MIDYSLSMVLGEHPNNSKYVPQHHFLHFIEYVEMFELEAVATERGELGKDRER